MILPPSRIIGPRSPFCPAPTSNRLMNLMNAVRGFNLQWKNQIEITSSSRFKLFHCTTMFKSIHTRRRAGESPNHVCPPYVSQRLLTMIGSHKWQRGQCEKLSRWVPKAPPCSPPDAGAHKLAGISGVQAASDLSFLFTGGKEKLL